MKLRIQNDSLRLRLTRKEVTALHDAGIVQCRIRFPGGRELIYSVASCAEAASVSVSYSGDSIRVDVPGAMATGWSENNEVTIEGCDAGVQILVEKDFQCLHQPEERDPEGFPNPLAG